jgi:hypothetical protein
LFNWFGYQVISSILEYRAETRLERQLDRDAYNPLALVTIKVPVTHLSYYTNSLQFDRVDGQIEMNGVEYNYVKLRLFRDSVELVCIPNDARAKYKETRNDFFKWSNDLQGNGNGRKTGSHPGAFKFFSVEYYPFQGLASVTDNYFFNCIKRKHFLLRETSWFPAVIDNPPE